MATPYDKRFESEAVHPLPDSQAEHYGVTDAVLTVCGLLGFILVPALIGVIGLMVISAILKALGFGGILTF